MNDLIEFAKNLATLVSKPDDYDCQVLYRNTMDEPRGYSKIDKVFLRTDTNLLTNNPTYRIVVVYHAISEISYFNLVGLKKIY